MSSEPPTAKNTARLQLRWRPAPAESSSFVADLRSSPQMTDSSGFPPPTDGQVIGELADGKRDGRVEPEDSGSCFPRSRKDGRGCLPLLPFRQARFTDLFLNLASESRSGQRIWTVRMWRDTPRGRRD
ncbi:hypothetical protein GN956_G18863 [Arapaima gigas]